MHGDAQNLTGQWAATFDEIPLRPSNHAGINRWRSCGLSLSRSPFWLLWLLTSIEQAFSLNIIRI
jgi:hypothetical protein